MTTNSKIRFKEITSDQVVLFPSNIGENIGINHPVRIVSQLVDKLNIDDLLSTYKGGGTSSYHPRVMLKILFYSYLNNIYSCRKIAQQLEENIYYMWISGNNTPNFRTINDFRGKRLKGKIHHLFSEMVKLMSELGYVSLDTQYIDGTKIESASNRYTFVWRKSIEKYKSKLESKVSSVLKTIDLAIESDDVAENQEELKVDSEQLRQKIEELNAKLEKLNKSQKKALKELETKDLPRLKKYEKDLDILGDRNSYSKTDPDATFMRMKDDHMKNGQLKPAYNIQISTESQLITNYTIHQRPGDFATLKPHLNEFENLFARQSSTIVADSGYGNQENYEYLEQENIEAYVKYNYFHKEQKRAFKNNAFLPSNLFYNKDKDFFICPIGQKMRKVGTRAKKSNLGYLYQVDVYQASNCNACPMRTQCHKSEGNRQMEINHELIRLREKARQKLLSEKGVYHRGKRPIEPEAVFGQVKFNNKFNRFTLRGLDKVNIEFGLIAISHNLRKWVKNSSNKVKNNCSRAQYARYMLIISLNEDCFKKSDVFYAKNRNQQIFDKIVA